MSAEKKSDHSDLVEDVGAFKKAFLAGLGDIEMVLGILEFTPDILFFMKDAQGRITYCTRNFAVQMGGECEEDILGLDAFDLCPRRLAEQYTEDDQRVMSTGKDLGRRLELNQGPSGVTGLFVTHKTPLYDRSGEVVGLVGITRSIAEAKVFLQPFDEFSGIIDHIRQNLSTKLPVPLLAEMAHLSASQFERRFRSVFGTSVAQYIVHVRVHEACRLLASSAMGIGEITQEVGFYDQSALTRFFKRIVGVTPSTYRKRFAE